MAFGADPTYIKAADPLVAEARLPMETAFYYLSLGAMYAVVLVLVAGLWVLVRGRSPNLSQKLMRWRVGLQFVAVVLLVAYAYVQHL